METHPTVVAIQDSSKAVCRTMDAAAQIIVGAVVAIGVENRTAFFTLDTTHTTAIGGMKGHLIASRCRVNSFDNVDLTVLRPD